MRIYLTYTSLKDDIYNKFKGCGSQGNLRDTLEHSQSETV